MLSDKVSYVKSPKFILLSQHIHCNDGLKIRTNRVSFLQNMGSFLRKEREKFLLKTLKIILGYCLFPK